MITLMYNKDKPPKRRIYANGYYSDWFEIQSGVAQGCPCSPLLFLIIAQGLVAALEHHNVEGIKVGKTRHLLSQFADDTTLLLRNYSELTRANAAIKMWCAATAMRENAKKREGLAMGNFRGSSVPPEHKSIKWAKEGEWVISLGVPVGNDLDQSAFWRRKLQGTRDKANRWAGLYHSGYYGRNLIIQAMFFGRLRYWLYSLLMDKHISAEVQADADRLWWSRDPVLDGNRVRVRRFVAKDTASGPRSKGGMGNMVWADHVTAFLASWINKYLHPSRTAWKQVLDSMLLYDKKGDLKFGAGRSVLMCPLAYGQRVKLLQTLPKRATYIRACIHAHWKMGYKQDVTEVKWIRGEPFWESARFRVSSEYRTRKYLINVTGLRRMCDVINFSTGQPHTIPEWERIIKAEHMYVRKQVPTDREVHWWAQQALSLTQQVPAHLLRDAAVPRDTPELKRGEVLAVIPTTVGETVRYGEFTPGRLTGPHVRILWIDAVGKAHVTEKKILVGDRKYVLKSTASWEHTRSATPDHRVIGVESETFPQMKGWTWGNTGRQTGEPTRLDRFRIKEATAMLTSRKFVSPANTEVAWQSRLRSKVNFEKVWRIRSFFATPRDQMAWLKLHHRNLFTASRDDTCDGKCRACKVSQENQLHLCECPIIWRDFWGPIVTVICEMGYPVSPDTTAYLAVGRATDDKCIGPEESGIMFIAWRCLYAATVQARVEKKDIRLDVVLRRCLKDTVRRLTAYGETWMRWSATRRHTRKTSIVPPKLRDKGVIKIGSMHARFSTFMYK